MQPNAPASIAMTDITSEIDALADRAREERLKNGATSFGTNDSIGKPDVTVLNEGRRPPPALPCDDQGPFLSWARWIRETADSKSAPRDYVACSLLAATAGLIGNTRWARAWEGWDEPSILWFGLVGAPSSGKSPAADPVLAAINAIEKELAYGFDETLREWQSKFEEAKARRAAWQDEVKQAVKSGMAPPQMPESAVEPDQPSLPRIIVRDATQEAIGALLRDMPRGLLFHRDELAGFLTSFDRYIAGGERAFYIEAFGGRPYTIDRVKNGGRPIKIPHLSISILGGIQPERLDSILFGGEDDGLAARFLLTWPEPGRPRRPTVVPHNAELRAALSRLRRTPLPVHGDTDDIDYIAVPLTEDAANRFQQWRETGHLEAQATAAGMFAGFVGKLPAMVLRLALTLEFLWWAGAAQEPEPQSISKAAVVGAIALVQGYFLPMAERCYGDAALPEAERHAAAIGRWIQKAKPALINARDLRRSRRAEIPGLSNDADKIKAALAVLTEARWVQPVEHDPKRSVRPRGDYEVNPNVFEL
jgi:hypothetical protein